VDLAGFYPAVIGWPLAQVLGSAVLVATLSGLALWRLKREPYLAVGWFWFVGMLVPVTGWVQVGLQSLACRYMYMPLIGLSIAVAWGMHAAFARSRRRDPVLAVVSMALLALLFSLTRTQVGYWQNDRALWEHTLAVTDDNWFAHAGLGDVMLGEGDFDGAITQFEEALKIWPFYAWGHVQLGTALSERNEFDRALSHLKRALKFEPELAGIRFWLGYVSERAGRPDAAAGHYRSELLLSPNHILSAQSLARLLVTDPDRDVRGSDEAIAVALRACELTHFRNPRSINLLAAAYAAAGRFDETRAQSRLALKLAVEVGDLELASTIKSRLLRNEASGKGRGARRKKQAPQASEAQDDSIDE
jgi:tetratricopeptide (TPR) repeat protein